MDHDERNVAEGNFLPPANIYPDQFAIPHGNGTCSYGAVSMVSATQEWNDGYYTPHYAYSMSNNINEDHVVSPIFAPDYDGSLDFFNRFTTANTALPQSQPLSMTGESQYWGSDMASPSTVRSPDSLISPSHSSRPTAAFEQQVNRAFADGQQQPDQSQTSSRHRRSQRGEVQVEKASKSNKGSKNQTKPTSKNEGKQSKKKDVKVKDSEQAAPKPRAKSSNDKFSSVPTPSSTSSSNPPKPAPRRQRPVKHAPPSPPEDEYADDDDDDDDEHLHTQRERNRMAATKCRAKTKAAISKLEGDERTITDRRDILAAEKALLEAQVLVLRDQVLSHHDADCGCDDIRLYVKNASRLIAETGGRHPIWGADGRGGEWAEYGEDGEYEDDGEFEKG